MNYVIENDLIRVTVSDTGAEIVSVYGKTTRFEYLWQGNPEFWQGRAPLLFPICGRLTDGKYVYNGKEYSMIIHGFARKKTFALAEKSGDKAVFVLESDEETLAQYPFPFRLIVTYTVNGSTVRTAMKVENTGKSDLRFSLGGHPGFNLPLKEDAAFDEHYLEFSKAKECEKLVMSDTCFYTGKTQPFPLENGKILRLSHSLFDNDAIFLSGMDDAVTLKCEKGGRSVTVRFNNMTHLGFWHKPRSEAPYVCIEPWHGVPSFDKKIDDFNSKAELISLAPDRTYETFFDITVSER